MPKRFLLTALLVVALAGCSGASETSAPPGATTGAEPPAATDAPADSGAAATDAPSDEPTDAATTPPDSTGGGAPISLKGSGTRKTKPFTMHSPARVDLTYSGSGNFISSIHPVGGSVLDAVSLSNTIGKTKLTTYIYETDLDGAKSYLDVLAGSGNWTAKITPGTPAAKTVPASFSGKWGQNTVPITLSGDFTVKFTHKGSGNFIVSLQLVGGSILDSESVSNEIGKVDDSTEVYGLSGDYYLDVVADGPWTISIQAQ